MSESRDPAVAVREPGSDVRLADHADAARLAVERRDPGASLPDALDQSVVEEGRHLWTPVFFGGLLVVLAGGVAARWLTVQVPQWTKGTPLEEIGANIDYPIYAIALGLLLNWLLHLGGLRDKLASGYRTEFFIKTGLVLLGATVVLSVLTSAAGPALIQAVIMISCVFGFTWFIAGKFGLDQRLRALLATAVSICGVSAAIAAAGAVRAKREQLAYAAGLVIIFALPSIFILPWLADLMGLTPAVTGAWLGGNIDTTAAVAAAGAIAGDEALKIATVVKLTQNALIGFVAVGLTAWFAFRVDRTAERPKPIELWRRFPKFVLGFVAASVIATIWLGQAEAGAADQFKSVVKTLNTYFLTLAFVSIGLEFKVSSLKEAGWRPVGVFAAATVFNLALALGMASLLFRNFSL
ncbi:MAG: putative sulfate exporter family transporter [Propionibacteriaceae bacterium]|jgi:uncharacterized integral membrane protein (TIGR00698 family)|nr:putative sulfate exporter family transporter [Propionibacteriaceae bacterium]